MQPFVRTDTGFSVAPGYYALVASDWTGSMPDPRETADQYDCLAISFAYEPVIERVGGTDVLVLPVGRDTAGCRGRSLAIGDRSVVCFGHLAIVPVEFPRSAHYPYAGHIDLIVCLEVGEGGLITPVDRCYALDGFKDVLSIDSQMEGAFSIEGAFFDMADDAIASAFEYGSEDFNARLDEHGFHLDVAALRTRLAPRRREPDVVRVLNMLPPCDSVIAYYAPVSP